MGTGLALLASYVLLVLGLLVSFGIFDPLALTLLLVSFVLLAVALWWVRAGSARDRRVPGTPIFAIALVLILVAALFRPPALYLTTPLFGQAYLGWLIVTVALVSVGYLVPRTTRGVGRAVFAIAVVGAIVFRLWMPIASPAPVIDVFTFSQESAAHLIDGKNPFTTPVSDAYEGAVSFGYSIRAYIYLPADLYLQTISYAITHDVRYAYVLAEMVVALALWRLSRRRWNEPVAELIVLLFLYNPIGLFVLEQAWVDSLILMFFAIYLMLRDRGRGTAAAFAYGYMLFLKQYMLFAFFQWFIVERNWRRVFIALGTGAATLVPFALWGWRGLLENGILFNVVVPFRDDSLTLFSFLSHAWGLKPPSGWTIIVGTLFAVVSFYLQRGTTPLRGYLFSVTLTMFGMFLFGTTGFCNWYYLVAGFMLFLIAAGGRRPRTNGPDALAPSGFALD